VNSQWKQQQQLIEGLSSSSPLVHLFVIYRQ